MNAWYAFLPLAKRPVFRTFCASASAPFHAFLLPFPPPPPSSPFSFSAASAAALASFLTLLASLFFSSSSVTMTPSSLRVM